MNTPKELFTLLSNGKSEEVIDLLLKGSFGFNNEAYSQIIHLSNRFKRARESNNNATVSIDQYNIELNRINDSLLAFIHNNIKHDNPDTLRVEKLVKNKKITSSSLIILPLIIFWSAIWFYPTKKDIVEFDPKISNNTVELKYYRFNNTKNKDSYLFKFVTKDTTKFKINPLENKFYPSFLVNKSNDISVENNIFSKFKYMNIEFDLSDVEDFKLTVAINQLTSKEIEPSDFYFELSPTEGNTSNPSMKITKSDYLNLYPWALPVTMSGLWVIFLTLFHQVRIKK